MSQAEAGLLGVAEIGDETDEEVGEVMPLLTTPVPPTEDNITASSDEDDDQKREDRTMEHDLRVAIKDRDVAAVRRLMAEGIPLKYRDKPHMTPLHMAIEMYCNWEPFNRTSQLPRKECLPEETEIIQEILSAADKAENKSDILNCLSGTGKSPLYLAIQYGFFGIVQALLRCGADVHKISHRNETVLHIAVRRPSILHYFLKRDDIENSPDMYGFAAIHTAAKYNQVPSLVMLVNKYGPRELERRTDNGSTLLHVAAVYGSCEVAKLLLEKTFLSEKVLRDNHGETPLNRSAKEGHKAFTALLLRDNAALSDRGLSDRTALKQIAQRFDDPLKFFDDVFDEKITESTAGIQKGRMINVDFKFLANEEGMSQIKVVEELVICGLKELLIHPLLETLLYLKWRCIIPVVYAIISIYAIFLVSFNAYVITVFYERDYNKTSTYSQNETETWSYECFNRWNDWLWIVLIYITIFIMIEQECIYIYLQKRRNFVHLESWVKLTLLLLSAVIPPLIRCGQPSDWLRHVVCVTLLLSWIQAMLLVSRFPDWGYYVLMIQKVACNIFKILFTSVCLVAGFSFCFMIQYRSMSPFDGPGSSFVKTLAMMSSEFDYGDLFGEDYDAVLQNTKPVVRLLFVIFVVFIAIVLMNFIVAIAVSDINELNILGNIRRLEKQMELIININILIDFVFEKIFSSSTREHFHEHMSKLIEFGEKWTVVYVHNSQHHQNCNHPLPLKLQKSIIKLARKKTQRKKDDRLRKEKADKLNAMYETLMGMSYDPKQFTKKDFDYTIWDDLDDNKTRSDASLKDKIKLLEDSNAKMKQSIDDVKESINKLISIMKSDQKFSSQRQKRATW